MEVMGWIGSMLLAFCGLPTALEAMIKKKCLVPWSLLISWGTGEILVLIYTQFKIGTNPLTWNYLANILFIFIMCYFKLWGKK